MKNKILLIVFIFCEVIANRAVAADPNTFEPIADIDLGFLMTNPKLPWGVDPFLKEPGFAQIPSTKENFKLGGIMYEKTSPMAVVNGKTVHEGDVVEDRLIEEIGENYVILKKHNSEIELNFPPLREPASLGEDEDDAAEEDLK